MDATFSAAAVAYRDQIRSFLSDHLPSDWAGVPALPEAERADWLEHWRSVLFEHRLLAPEWPHEYGGGGLSIVEQAIVAEEFALAGAPTGVATDVLSINMMGPTFLTCGTEEQKRHYLPRILSGEDRWCQGYSEPDAGSDLASLSTRAVLDGDEWVINGQKTWTSHSHLANWIFVLCRTNPEEPRHRGISFLLCPLNQPGVEVRAVPNAAGGRDFNEVFFTDARTRAECIVGEPNEGWKVTNALLTFERGGDATSVPVVMQALLDNLIESAAGEGRLADPLVRHRLAELRSRVQVLRFGGLRSLTSALNEDVLPGAASISKVSWTELYQDITLCAAEILGAHACGHEGVVTDVPLPPSTTSGNDPATWLNHLLCARPASIYSGTNEIQRNIIGEQVLGLPREPRRAS